MNTATVELTGVSKTYQGSRSAAVAALCDFSLRVESGSFVVLQGPSGCGKTTLLLMVGGLLSPDQGMVRVRGQDLAALSAEGRAAFRARTIGFVFQQFHLIPYLTALDNVLAPALAVGGAGLRQRAEESITRLGLSDRRDHLPGELSSGERQRVALARALLHQPALILADEPTGNLDEESAMAVLGHLRAYAREGGAVLMATHRTDVSADVLVRLRSGATVTDHE